MLGNRPKALCILGRQSTSELSVPTPLPCNVSPYNLLPWKHVDESGLKLRDPPASALSLVEIKSIEHQLGPTLVIYLLKFFRQGFSVALVPVLELSL